MNYLSVCSGIEAATAAWHPLGWKPVAFSEIEAFPSAVLAHHYPETPNLGDMTRYKEWQLDLPIGLLVGGTPCQAFSVAGLRKGLADPRGNLALTFCEIADHLDPEYVLWENVPGVLSSKDNAFGCFLGGLSGADAPLVPERGWDNAGLVAGPKRTVAWRVLDAQFYGVAQRRRRVFVLAVRGPGNFGGARALLPVGEGVYWDYPPSREAGERVAPSLGQSTRSSGGIGMSNQELFSQGGGGLTWEDPLVMAHGQGGAEVVRDGEPSLTCNHEAPILAHTLRAQHDASEDGTGRGVPLVVDARQDPDTCADFSPPLGRKDTGHAIAIPINSDADRGDSSALTPSADAEGRIRLRDPGLGIGSDGDPMYCLTSAKQHAVATSMAVRRLTPRECERLQGFPDDYTHIPWRGKPAQDCPDGPRYKALGNSMAVPCMEWIGQRIQMVEATKELQA